MDIQGAAAVAAQPIASTGRSGSPESVVEAQQRPADSAIERKEVERSETDKNVGAKVDIDA